MTLSPCNPDHFILCRETPEGGDTLLCPVIDHTYEVEDDAEAAAEALNQRLADTGATYVAVPLGAVYDIEDWQAAAFVGDTLLGYAEWIAHKLTTDTLNS